MFIQQDNNSINLFVEGDSQFTVFKRPSQSPAFNPIEQLWDLAQQEIAIGDVQTRSLQQLREAPCQVSEESFQHLVECNKMLERRFVQQRIKPVLKAKGGPTLC